MMFTFGKENVLKSIENRLADVFKHNPFPLKKNSNPKKHDHTIIFLRKQHVNEKHEIQTSITRGPSFQFTIDMK